MSAEPDDFTAELDGEVQDGAGGDGADVNNAQAELEAMKARLRAMEEESKKLQEAQAKISKDTADPASTAAAEALDREEADSRSIYIGNVDYACTPEELQQHFQQCGTVNRVTILTDKMGNAKGFAYLEFLEADAINSALLLDGSELHGRQIKVNAKRTNVPGLKQRGRGRGRAPRGGFRGGGYGGYGPGYGYGYPPRGRGRGRGYYSPY